MFAFESAARFESIYRRAVQSLSEFEHPRISEITSAIENAYKAERQKMASEILSPFPMAENLATFELRGRARLGDAIFNSLFGQIQAIDTKVELLIFGFSEHDAPHIFRTSTAGEIQSCDALGIGAIGTGQHVALDFLNGTDDLWKSSDIGLITYRLCEAKFTAEGADGVGPETVFASFGPEGVATSLHDKGLKVARSIWRRRRQAPVPDRVLRVLRKGVSFDPEHGITAFNAFKAAYEKAAAETASVREALDGMTLSEHQMQRLHEIASTLVGYSEQILKGVIDWDESSRKPPGLHEALASFIATGRQLVDFQREVETGNSQS